jgi:hypothetical protein
MYSLLKVESTASLSHEITGHFESRIPRSVPLIKKEHQTDAGVTLHDANRSVSIMETRDRIPSS